MFRTLLISIIVLIGLYWLGKGVFYFFPRVTFESIFVWVNYEIGYPRAYLFAALPIVLLALAYSIRIEQNRRQQLYLALLIDEVHRMEEERFNHKIPVEPVGGLGQLAVDINRMVERLKISMDEERRAEQTKNELITNVSHDLRTPLTTITGYLGLIEQDRYRDEVELRYYTNIAYEESLRLKQLMDDLFQYTRLRNREMKLSLNRINLVEMLHQTTAQMQWQFQESGVQCRLHFPNPQLMLIADGDKLQRVFENLISNAIRYGNDGKYIDIHARQDGSNVVAEVVNYGEAIPQADIPHLFERFYRVEKSRAKHTGGSGIGLAIAKSIVDLHQGTITADSDEERTVFTVIIRSDLKK